VPLGGNAEVASVSADLDRKCGLKGCASFVVPATTCLDLVRDFGLPDVLKVDIEGLDSACVASLARDAAARPRYVLIEDRGALDALVGLGYARFKLQAGYSVARAAVARGALGGHPWEVINAVTGRVDWSGAGAVRRFAPDGAADLYAALPDPGPAEAAFLARAPPPIDPSRIFDDPT